MITYSVQYIPSGCFPVPSLEFPAPGISVGGIICRSNGVGMYFRQVWTDNLNPGVGCTNKILGKYIIIDQFFDLLRGWRSCSGICPLPWIIVIGTIAVRSGQICYVGAVRKGLLTASKLNYIKVQKFCHARFNPVSIHITALTR